MNGIFSDGDRTHNLFLEYFMGAAAEIADYDNDFFNGYIEKNNRYSILRRYL